MIGWLAGHWLWLAAAAVIVACVLQPALMWRLKWQVLLLAALTWGGLQWLDAKGLRAELAGAKAAAMEQALHRDATAGRINREQAQATARRISEGEQASQGAQERIRERIIHAPAVAGCGGPDPAIVRDVREADDRLRAAADRMRGVAAPADHPRPSGRK